MASFTAAVWNPHFDPVQLPRVIDIKQVLAIETETGQSPTLDLVAVFELAHGLPRELLRLK